MRTQKGTWSSTNGARVVARYSTTEELQECRICKTKAAQRELATFESTKHLVGHCPKCNQPMMWQGPDDKWTTMSNRRGFRRG